MLIFSRFLVGFGAGSGSGAGDPLFHETYPRIRIHIKIKQIRNTGNMDKNDRNYQLLVEVSKQYHV